MSNGITRHQAVEGGQGAPWPVGVQSAALASGRRSAIVVLARFHPRGGPRVRQQLASLAGVAVISLAADAVVLSIGGLAADAVKTWRLLALWPEIEEVVQLFGDA